MRKEILEKIKELSKMWCNDRLKESINEFLLALDSDKEHEFTIKLINDLEWSLCGIDELYEFANSDKSRKLFKNSEEHLKFLSHVEHLKESNEQYCDCPACKKVLEILKYKDEIIG